MCIRDSHLAVSEAVLHGPGDLPQWFVRKFGCPECDAAPLEACREDGKPRPAHHRARLRCAQGDASSHEFAETLAPDPNDVQAIACPQCGATTDESCIRENGLKRKTFHAARRYAAAGLVPY